MHFPSAAQRDNRYHFKPLKLQIKKHLDRLLSEYVTELTFASTRRLSLSNNIAN